MAPRGDMVSFDPARGLLVAVLTATRAERLVVLMDLLNDPAAAMLCRSELMRFEVHTWERQGGSDTCEVLRIGADDFSEW